MLKFGSVMLGTSQRQAMADFYKAVFQQDPAMEDEGFTGWLVGGTFFSVGEHSEVHGQNQDPSRIMFNYETSQVKEEFDRISAIEGATVIKEPYELQGAWIATLADPDGNYFQLMTPWDDVTNSPKDE